MYKQRKDIVDKKLIKWAFNVVAAKASYRKDKARKIKRVYSP